MQWYLTRYAQLANGSFELLYYTEMPSLEVAQYKANTHLPNNEFYEVECKVGSLLPLTPKPYWIARDRYSHKPDVAQQQIEAELKAKNILSNIENNTIDFRTIFADIKKIRPFLTTPQFEVLFNAFKSNPFIVKLLYERSATK